MARRKRKPSDDVAACVLGSWQGSVTWGTDFDQSICGPDAPDPSTAAKKLADKRWQKSVRIQARDLRTDTAGAIARAQERQSNPLPVWHYAIAARLARGEN